jgi:NADH-quinone oxidoreductase subunit I
MAMMTYVKEILVGFYSLLAGMAVTIRYFVKPIVTVQYPRQKLEMTPSYRGHTELLIDPETGTHTCIACEMCARICPSKLITVEGVKVEPKKKLPSKYVIEYQYCSLCGLCLESCPTNALKWSNEYRLANFRREDSVIDLLARLANQQRSAGLPVTPIPVAMVEPEVAEGAEAPEKKAPPKAAPKAAPAKPAPAEPAAETAPAEKAPAEEPPAEAAPAKEVEE